MRNLLPQTGNRAIVWVKAEFNTDFDRHRAYIASAGRGTESLRGAIKSALDTLHPLALPFLDLFLLMAMSRSDEGVFNCLALIRAPSAHVSREHQEVFHMVNQHMQEGWQWLGECPRVTLQLRLITRDLRQRKRPSTKGRPWFEVRVPSPTDD